MLSICVLFAYQSLYCSDNTGPGIAEADENCCRFLQKTMPDAFNKVGVVFPHGSYRQSVVFRF